MKSAEDLCLACGLCCDGTLFGHVRLVAGDDAKKLKALGLPVVAPRTGSAAKRFPQPCAALCADGTCRVYADRPAQCRSFECGVFKAARAGEIPFSNALRTVKQARRLAATVRRLLRALGDTDDHLGLDARFARAQERLESGRADAAAADLYADLSQAMHRLSLLTHDRFHTRAAVE